MEFFNKLIKEVRRKLGPNVTNQKCIIRHCNAIGVNKEVLDNFDDECHIIRRSGKHVVKSTRVDLEKIVGELMSQRAFRWTPDRKYQYFNNINSTLLEDFDLLDMFRLD